MAQPAGVPPLPLGEAATPSTGRPSSAALKSMTFHDMNAPSALPLLRADGRPETPEKERQLRAKNERRAQALVPCLKRFIVAHQEASRAEYLIRFPPPAVASAPEADAGKKKDDKKKDAGKGKKAPPPPTTEAWLLLLKDFDEVMFKKKKAGVDNLYQAVSMLPPTDKAALGNIVSVTGPKVFKDQAMNEVQEAVKSGTFMAVAAACHTSTTLPNPALPGANVVLRQKGVTAREACEMGLAVPELLAAGYPRKDVILSCGASLRPLLAAGVGIAELARGGYPGLVGHAGVAALLASGCDVSSLLECGQYSLLQLRLAGVPPEQLAALGVEPADLQAAGYGSGVELMASNLRQSVKVLQGCTPNELYGTWLGEVPQPAKAPSLMTSLSVAPGRRGGMRGSATGGTISAGVTPKASQHNLGAGLSPGGAPGSASSVRSRPLVGQSPLAEGRGAGGGGFATPQPTIAEESGTVDCGGGEAAAQADA